MGAGGEVNFASDVSVNCGPCDDQASGTLPGNTDLCADLVDNDRDSQGDEGCGRGNRYDGVYALSSSPNSCSLRGKPPRHLLSCDRGRQRPRISFLSEGCVKTVTGIFGSGANEFSVSALLLGVAARTQLNFFTGNFTSTANSTGDFTATFTGALSLDCVSSTLPIILNGVQQQAPFRLQPPLRHGRRRGSRALATRGFGYDLSKRRGTRGRMDLLNEAF